MVLFTLASQLILIGESMNTTQASVAQNTPKLEDR